MSRIIAIDDEVAYHQARIDALLAEKRALIVKEGGQPPKANPTKRKRRCKAEMEKDVSAAIRYLIDEEYNGATQCEAEKRFGLPARILSKGKWSEMIEQFRKMR